MLKKHFLGYYEIKEKPSLDELSSYYAQKYYQDGTGSYEVTYKQSELDFINAKLSRIHYLVNKHHAIQPGLSLLDVGCGEGFALAYFDANDFKVSGLDFSSAGIRQQNPDFEKCINTGDLFSLLQEKHLAGPRYDVILLQNVLEHVIDPLNLLHSIKELLTPEGLVIVTVPNDFSLTQKILLEEDCIDREFWVSPPDHLSYFNRESLQSILMHSGFSVLDLIADFPIDWYLFNRNSNYVHDPSTGKEAHLSRVMIENMLHANDISDVVDFYRSLAKLGSGRDITAVACLDDIA